MITTSQIRNFTIFLRELDDGNFYLFQYFEYVGNKYEADMKKIAADPATPEWRKLTDPCQQPWLIARPTSAGPVWRKSVIMTYLSKLGKIRFRAFLMEGYGDSYRLEIEAFLGGLAKGTPAPVSATDGFRAVYLAEAAGASLRLGEGH